MRYLIHESNMERLNKKLTTISNKCAKYGCQFSYERVGEQFIEDEDHNVNRYIEIETEGVAKINDWMFVATVEFHEGGNVIRKCGNIDVEVPERYYTSEPICEHCNTKKRRNSAYVVMNVETGEFKQVGRSCLKDFTCGLSAEAVAQYIAAFDCMIEGETVEPGWHPVEYFDTKEYLQYVVECVNHFGYYGSQCEMPTKTRAYTYLAATCGKLFPAKYLEETLEEMKSVQFNCYTDEVEQVVEEALTWITEQNEENNYLHNVKLLAAQKYIVSKDFGFIASLIPTYYKAMKIEQERRQQQEAESKSAFVGNIGDRITVAAQTVECVASWDTQYGMTYVYKIIDENDNVYTWKTGKGLSNKAMVLIGTVKEHKEFRGIKQTELTRCKVK